MTQPLGQRGGQPLYHPLKSMPRNAAGRPDQGQKQASSGVKFGGGADAICSGLAKVVPVSIFEKITEVFLAGFLAQDVIAMWLPRVWTSLKTGREHYEPNEDPQARHLSFHEQAKKWAVENYKGLNWVNFNEETKREFATGPGLLAVPAFMFLGNRYLGNRAKEMSYHSLQDLGHGFSEHLQGKTLSEAEYWEKAVPNYIASLFADPKLKASPEHARFIQDWSKKWAAELKKQAERGRWDRLKESMSRFFKQSPPTKLEEWSAELNEKIRSFNRSSDDRMLAYAENAVIRDPAPLHHAEQTWISYRPLEFQKALSELGAKKTDEALQKKAAGLCHQVPVSHVTGDLNRFGDMAKTIWRNYEAHEGKAAISEVAAHTMKTLAANKLFLGVGTTVLTAAYLLRLAFWAQSHDSYQAVRLLRDDVASHKGHHAHAAQQGQQRTPELGVQAGLPFGAQPAFLSQGQAPLFRAPYPASRPSALNPFSPSYPSMSTGFGARQAYPQRPADWRRS